MADVDSKISKLKEYTAVSDNLHNDMITRLDITKNDISLDNIWELFSAIKKYKITINDFDDLFKKINSSITDAFNKDLRSSLYMEFNVSCTNFNSKSTYINKEVLRWMEIVNSDMGVVESIEKKIPFHLIFDFIGKSQKEKSFTIEHSKVFVRVRSEFNVETDTVNNERIHDLIIQICNKWLSEDDTSDTLQNWLIQIKKKKPKDIENDIIELMLNSIEYALSENPKLLRSSRVNIYSKILNSQNLKNAYGDYNVDKSDSSNIFLRLLIEEGIIYAYLNHLSHLDKRHKQYETIIREMTHSYDYRLNNDQSVSEYASELIGDVPRSEIISLLNILCTLREEGLARINGYLSAKVSSNFWEIFSFDELSYSFENAKSNIFSIISKSGEEKITSKNIADDLNNVANNGTCHNYGMYMLLIIFIYKERDNILFFLTPGQNMRKIFNDNNITIENAEDFIRSKNWPKVDNDKISPYLKHGAGLSMFSENLPDRLKQIVTLISLMKPADFFKLYIEACKNLNIDPGPLTPESIKHLNVEKTKQFNKVVKEMGF